MNRASSALGTLSRVTMATHDTNTLIAQNVVTVYDIIIALIRQEWINLQPTLPTMRDIAELVRQKLPRYGELIERFRAVFTRLVLFESWSESLLPYCRHKPQVLLGRDALYADEMHHFGSEERLTDFLDDDLDDVRSTGNSTICTTSNDKRMAEMEAQLAELRSMVASLQMQKVIVRYF